MKTGELLRLRAKFDDALIYGINASAERDWFARELTRADETPEVDKTVPSLDAPEQAAVDAFEAAFVAETAREGYNTVQLLVVAIFALCLGALSRDFTPEMLADFFYDAG